MAYKLKSNDKKTPIKQESSRMYNPETLKRFKNTAQKTKMMSNRPHKHPGWTQVLVKDKQFMFV